MMADYFDLTCFAVPVAAGTADEVCETYGRVFFPPDGSTVIEPLGERADEVYGLPRLESSHDGSTVFVSDDMDGVDLEMVARVVQWLQGEHGAPSEVWVQWASVCSKGRVDAFGGGLMLVTPDRATSTHTCQLEDYVRQLAMVEEVQR